MAILTMAILTIHHYINYIIVKTLSLLKLKQRSHQPKGNDMTRSSLYEVKSLRASMQTRFSYADR